MVGNMTVGARLCAYGCKASCRHGENKREWFYIIGGNILDGRRMIGLVLAFGLVLMCSPTADTCCCLLGHMCPCLWLHDRGWDCVHYPSVIGVAVWMSRWGGIPDWGCGAGYMHPFSVWVVYMHVGVYCWGVYSGSEMCTVMIMWFCIRIWDFQCFSAITDVSVDYLTGFYNRVLVTPPPNVNIVGSWIMLHCKLKKDGSISMHKSRLVAQGFTQQEGIDFNDTFSLMAKLTTVRIIAAIVVRNDWELEQTDMDAAYLNTSLKEYIYIYWPRGFEAPSKEDKVIHLKWAICGLR